MLYTILLTPFMLSCSLFTNKPLLQSDQSRWSILRISMLNWWQPLSQSCLQFWVIHIVDTLRSAFIAPTAGCLQMCRQDYKANRLLACLLWVLPVHLLHLTGSPMQILCSCSQFCLSNTWCSISLHHISWLRGFDVCQLAKHLLLYLSVWCWQSVCVCAAYSPTSPSYSPTSPGASVCFCQLLCCYH